MNIDLPAGIPAPKFQLFQKVKHVEKCCGKKERTIIATISGLSYIDFNTAILTDLGFMGWQYELNIVIGKSQDEVLSMTRHDVTFNAYENELALAGEEETNV